MGVLFLTFLGSFEAKQVTVIPVGQRQGTSQRIASSEFSTSSSLAPDAFAEIVETAVQTAPPEKLQFIEKVTLTEPETKKKPVPVSATLLHPSAPESSESTASDASSEHSVVTESSSSAASAENIPVAAVSSSLQSSADSSSSSAPPTTEPANSEFPAFDHTSFPVGKVPNWGAMRTPQEWNRSYAQMTSSDFVAIPRYDMSTLTVAMASLTNPVTDASIPTLTAKLFYSTRYLGQYDLDAAEGSGKHAGVDLKLARGTPISSIAGGRVTTVTKTQNLGLHVVIEHRLKNGETYYSVYGHFDSASVNVGQDVKPGQTIGIVGITGNTSAPHLHLQVDRGQAGENHVPFAEGVNAATGMVNPITFIGMYRNGE